MTKFNPDFWEVTISQESWRQFSTKDHLFYEEPDEGDERGRRTAQVQSVWPKVGALLDEVLTRRQRDVVRLYFFERLNQRQIAEQLGVSQQAVSEHLYGKARNGRAVGGAIRKLRKECAKRGIQWEIA